MTKPGDKFDDRGLPRVRVILAPDSDGVEIIRDSEFFRTVYLPKWEDVKILTHNVLGWYVIG